MRKLHGLLLWFACLSISVWGQDERSSQLHSLIEKELPAGSEVGISVYDLTDRKPLYTYRDTYLSRPASTMKLLTTITALSHPDAEEPFLTEVWYKGVIEHDTLQGDLYIIGGFDPELGETEMASLVDDVATLPFSVIKGKVYGDVSMTDSLYFGSGWVWDDMPFSYQPYLSPLMFAKGVVTVTATPNATRGEAAYLEVKPISSYYSLLNKTKSQTPTAGEFTLTRGWLEEKNNIIVSGNVDHKQRKTVNVRSSQNFFLHTFLDRLQTEGITVTEGYDFSDFNCDNTSIQVSRLETPVQTVINQMLKQSNNLNAEAMLYRLGAQATGKKHVSASDGIDEIEKLIRLLGHNPEEYKIADGCGLSNYDYLSPKLLLDFLKYAYSQTNIFQKLYKALPIAGVDGTLKNRMKSGKAYKKVHAKTGSYTGINALAGYLKTADGHDIAFVIMNQNVLSGEGARKLQDRVCELLCE